jgi:hypothetical protein
MVLVKEILWQLTHVFTIFELSGSYLASVLEITIFVQDFMHFILYFGFQVQVFEQSWDHFLNFLSFSVF